MTPAQAEEARVQARALAATLIGLTVEQAEQRVALHENVVLLVLRDGPTRLAAMSGRISVQVVDGRITDARPG